MSNRDTETHIIRDALNESCFCSGDFFYSKQKNHLKMQTSYKILADKTWSVITQAYALAQTVCQALISPHPRTFSIRNSISSISSSIFIQWIPGHSSIPGNDITDKAAKEVTLITTDAPLPISLSNSIRATNTNELQLSINLEVFIETSNRLPTEEMTFSLLAYGLVTTLL